MGRSLCVKGIGGVEPSLERRAQPAHDAESATRTVVVTLTNVDEPPVLDTLPTGLGVRENASNQVRLQADPDPCTRELPPPP